MDLWIYIVLIGTETKLSLLKLWHLADQCQLHADADPKSFKFLAMSEQILEVIMSPF